MKKELAERGIIEEVQKKLAGTFVLSHESGQVEPFVVEALSNVFSKTMKEITDRSGLISHAVTLLAVVRNLDMADTAQPPIEKTCQTCKYIDLCVSEFPCILCCAGGVALPDGKVIHNRWEAQS